MLNLDTHVLIYALRGELTPRERKLLSGDEWSISAIVLWELAKLAQLKRVSLSLADRDLRLALAKLHVWPLTIPICRQIEELDFNSDPADELIAATSIVEKIPLVTRDKRILKSKLIPFA